MTGDVQITVEVGGSGNRYISVPCGCHFTITGTPPRTRITWNCPHYRGVYVPISDPPSMFVDPPDGVVAVPAASVRSSGRQSQSGWLPRTPCRDKR